MWKWIGVPKGIALLAFLLPWLTVSCSGQPLLKASGLGLAIGQIDTSSMPVQPQAGNEVAANWFLLLAIIAIVAGLILLFRKQARGALAVIGTSVAAIILILLGMSRYSQARMQEAIAAGKTESGQPPFDLAFERLIHIKLEAGYWIALIALVLAAAIAFMTYRGTALPGITPAAPRNLPPPVSPDDPLP